MSDSLNINKSKFIKALNNTCHSMHRFDCYEKAQDLEIIDNERKLLIEGHLWNGADICAREVLYGPKEVPKPDPKPNDPVPDPKPDPDRDPDPEPDPEETLQ